jgi:hypothetical protein
MKLFTEKLLTKISKKTVIPRGEDNVPYLVRYSIIQWGFIALKVHHILISDEHCMHDHPWGYFSIILEGGYFEVTPKDEYRASNRLDFNEEVNMKWYSPGSLLIRPKNWIHRLELPPGQTCWTLFFTFRKVKRWGFYTKYGWIEDVYYKAKNHCD